jgi:hypothetical protein
MDEERCSLWYQKNMNELFVILVFAFLARSASAAESVSLYAQGCLPYSESDEHGIHFNFNCEREERINVVLTDLGSGVEKGEWSKAVQLGTSTFVVLLEVERYAGTGGGSMSVVTGKISQSDGTGLVAVTEALSADLSISVASLTPFGEKKGIPNFFFGSPSRFNAEANEVAMRRSLRAK